MAATLPLELQILTALLTPVIAVAVGYVAYQQWRTAREKLVLDLFKDRLAVYTK
jgi:hypothetical protein